MRGKHALALLVMLVLLCALLPTHALAEAPLLPDVTAEMTDAAFWMEGLEDADAILADAKQIEALNRSFLQTPACCMNDLENAGEEFDERAFYRELWQSAFSSAASWMRSPYYDSEGEELIGPVLNERLQNIGGEYAAESARVRYGICVRRADLLALPGRELMTDELGDLDFDYNQLSSVRVNEPVIVKAESADGAYYYCDTDCVSGWVAAEDIALCAGREEWLAAWRFPDEEAIVVTAGKLYLENSNFSPDSSEVLLTMGTVLRRVREADYDAEAVNRAPYFNYPVWLPVRLEDGSYGRTIALIPQNRSVSEGCLPLTSRRVAELAMSRLGDVYGWGGMLNSVDCSNFVRDVYRCFGLILPRNTTWQSMMPVLKYDVSEADEREKEAILDTLPPGAVLYFSGHEMIYLGKEGDRYYVISAVSSVKRFEEDSADRLRVRSIVISSLDTQRLSGKTWLQSLNLMLLPCVPEDTGAEAAAPELAGETEAPAEQDVLTEDAAPAGETETAPAAAAEKAEAPDAAPAPALPGGPAQNVFMQQAIEEALNGIDQGHGGPFGCVLVKDGEIVGRGHDRSRIDGDPDGHAELAAIRDAIGNLNAADLSGCVLYTTGEPCSTCLLACLAANVDRVCYGCTRADVEKAGFADEELSEPAVDRTEYGDFLECRDRSACLRLLDAYAEMAEKPAA